MKLANFLGATCIFITATACGSKWSMQESKFYKYQNKDVRVAAKVVMNEKARVNLSGGDGVDFKMRLYTVNFGSVLTEIEKKAGATLESSGTVNVPEVLTIAISDFRLGGTPNTYQDFCAEIQMDKSNIPDWTRIGCINYNDTPSESPTGGLQ